MRLVPTLAMRILVVALSAALPCAVLAQEPLAPAPVPTDPAPVPVPAEPAPAPGPDRGAEIAIALGGLKSAITDERITTCKSLSFSGITDERVYDQIERNVLSQNARLPKSGYGGSADRDIEQEIGWCAKALAYAGNEKYRPALERLAASPRRLSTHAEAALERIGDFARWNAIMNNGARHRPGQSWEMTRAFNMLESGEPPLEREGLKLIKELKEDPTPLHDLVEARLLAAYARPLAPGSEQEDIVAWYCRSLAASRNDKYRDSLQRVADGTPSKKVRTYARKALGDLGDAP